MILPDPTGNTRDEQQKQNHMGGNGNQNGRQRYVPGPHGQVPATQFKCFNRSRTLTAICLGETLDENKNKGEEVEEEDAKKTRETTMRNNNNNKDQ